MCLANRLLFWAWPPYEKWLVDKEINRVEEKDDIANREKIFCDKIRNSFPEDADDKELEIMANEIQESEEKRKETLENKAVSFISGIGISLGIASLIFVLFANKQPMPMPPPVTLVVGFIYLFAIINLLVAARYAVKARQVAAFASPCADTFIDSMKNNRWKIKERIVLTVYQAKWNEKELLNKSNCLSVAENMFLRGISLIAFAVVISVTLKIVILNN